MIKTPEVVHASTVPKPKPESTDPLDIDPEITVRVPIALVRQTSGALCTDQTGISGAKQGDIDTEDEGQNKEEEIPSTPTRAKDRKCWAPDRNQTKTPFPTAEADTEHGPTPIPEAQVVPETEDDKEDVVPSTPVREKDRRCWAPQRPGPRKRKVDTEEEKEPSCSIILITWEVPENKKPEDSTQKKPHLDPASTPASASATTTAREEDEYEGLDEISRTQLRESVKAMQLSCRIGSQMDAYQIKKRAIECAKLMSGFNRVEEDSRSITLVWTYTDNQPGVLKVTITATQIGLCTRDGSTVKVGSPQMAAYYFKPFIDGVKPV